jgi:CNP1-like family
MTKTLLASALLLVASCMASAQFVADDPDWKESEVPPPPVFDLKRLVQVEVFARSELKWGVDPNTIVISKDGIVRYIVVAQSPSGVVNAMYEGIRCNKGEFRTYARHNADSGWVMLSGSEWKAIRSAVSTGHLSALARQGLCDDSAPPTDVREAVRRLRAGGRTPRY